MTNKKTDKQDKKAKPTTAKPADAKAAQPVDAKKTVTNKPVVKASQAVDAKKPSAGKPVAKAELAADSKKPAAAKTESANAKKSSVDSDTKKSTPPKADTPTSATKDTPVKPNPNEALRLATQAMNHFITSKQEKSMAHFFQTVAKAWQKITSVEKLNTAFSSIIADSADWSFLKEVPPQLIKDGLSDRGDWVVVGVYPTKPKKLIFDQIFLHEDGEWKLAELKLYIAD